MPIVLKRHPHAVDERVAEMPDRRGIKSLMPADGRLAVRIDAVPRVLECLPHADILHAELVLQQTHGV